MYREITCTSSPSPLLSHANSPDNLAAESKPRNCIGTIHGAYSDLSVVHALIYVCGDCVTRIALHNHHHNRDLKCTITIRLLQVTPLQPHPRLPHPIANLAMTNVISISIIMLFHGCYINRNMQYVSFGDSSSFIQHNFFEVRPSHYVFSSCVFFHF